MIGLGIGVYPLLNTDTKGNLLGPSGNYFVGEGHQEKPVPEATTP